MTTSNNPAYETLHQTALKAPSSSGVYLWRNSEETIIYVGKAKNLKNRLSSYFSGEKQIKTQLLIENAASIEYIVTNNEYEAFLLENNLIKKHTPKYNIQLKDGKSYPVLKITNEDFPRFYKTRQVRKDGSTYFGPFPDSGALDTFIDTLYRLFPVRHCRTFKKRDAPCMYYHIGRCKAPCCDKIDKQSYNEFIGEIKSLLNGKDEETIAKITAEMKAAAAALNFEKAARIRDGLKALTVMQNQNIVEDFDSEDRDYIAHYREGELVSFTVLKIRAGKLTARDNFRTISLNEDDELLEEFVTAYYIEDNSFPPKIYVSSEDNIEILNKWISGVPATSSRRAATGSASSAPLAVATQQPTASQPSVSLTQSEPENDCQIVPIYLSEKSVSEKKHIAALEMAMHNAKEDIIRRLRERGDFPALEELKELLGLPKLPVRIEGFDIAHIGGKFPVASLISFYNGNPDKKNYREFRLKTTNGVIDDFASMREATSRRYSRLLNEGQELPDLLLIDGGIGQVNAVDGILKALGVSIPIAGLAKRDEEIWRPYASKPICLPKRSDALRLLQRVRDETHRFATSRNQELRTKENTVSAFKGLPHIGEQREKILIKTFMTLENLASAQESAVAQALHVNAAIASEILISAKNMTEQRKEIKDAKKMRLESELNSGNEKNEFQQDEQDSIYARRLAELAMDDLLEVAED